MALARGEYVAFLDSDDVWKPWKLAAQVACLAAAPHVGMVWTDMEAIDPQGNVFDPTYLRTMYSAYRWFRTEDLFPERQPLANVVPEIPGLPAGGTFHVGDIFSQMVMGNLVHTSTVLLRRERLEKVDGFNEDWRSGEDYDFHLRTCREGPVGFIDAASILYQRGMADRLTAYRELVATNFLRTVTRVVERDRSRITLPKWMLRAVFAEAHAWVGEELANRGDRSGARSHLAKSLAFRPWQPRTAGLLALGFLPAGARRCLLGTYHGLKGVVRRPCGTGPAAGPG
jgi:hypothetical protein